MSRKVFIIKIVPFAGTKPFLILPGNLVSKYNCYKKGVSGILVGRLFLFSSRLRKVREPTLLISLDTQLLNLFLLL